MSSEIPELNDYLRLFERYGQDLGSIYQHEGDDDPYAFLFEQIILLLTKPSPFNLSLPEPFRQTAHRYHQGEAATHAHFRHFDNGNIDVVKRYRPNNSLAKFFGHILNFP